MLSEKFDKILVKISNPMLQQPVYYNSPIAIRFEIGCETPIYSDTSPSENELLVNPKYVEAALQRARAIYTALPQAPNLLRIDIYPNENEPEHGNGFELSMFHKLVPFPHEQREITINDEGEQYTVLQLYWDLCKIDFLPDLLLKEIIKADLGGIAVLTSCVYFANTEEVYLYHVYDDRGADLVAERKETLCPIYQSFNQWILDYDKKKIDNIFAK